MTDETQEGTVVSEVTFKYTKSVLCRVIHVDGAWGGITPQGYIQLDLYSEKHEVPDSQAYDVLEKDSNPQKSILKQKQLVQRGMNREVEVEVIFSPQVARALKTWLEERLAMIEAAEQKKQSDS